MIASPKNPAAILWVLLALFFLRVLGQVIVAIAAPTFLPPMQEWFSGVLPYPYLLGSQILIIGLMAHMCHSVHRQKRFWGTPKRGLGEFLIFFGVVYFTVMLLRYTIRMTLYPLERWVGGSIPIFFHWILAAFVLTLGVFHLQRTMPRTHTRFSLGWRILCGLIGVLTLGGWLCFQLAPTILASLLDVRPARYAVRIEPSLKFKTSDGVNLVAKVFHPQRATDPPIILVRIPYSKGLKNDLFANVIGRFWAERGYTVVLQGTRGRYESGGKYQPLVHEEADGKETLAWLLKQPWFSVNIGMWGGSYFGYTQLVLVDSEHPKLSALIVQLASSDMSRMFYINGAFALESALQWALGSYGEVDDPPDQKRLDRASHTIPLISADTHSTGTKISFLRDWMRHPPGTKFWQPISATKKLDRLQGAVLSMAGWYDPFLSAQLEDFQYIQSHADPEIAKQSRLIIGPWAHARTVQLPDGFRPRHYRLESLAPSLDWFDQHLLNRHAGANRTKVRIFVMGLNQWRDENEWPLKRAVHTTYHLANLHPGRIGTLDLHGNDEKGSSTFVYDPSEPGPARGGAMIGPNAGPFKQPDTVARSDILTYDTPELASTIEVTGYPKALLRVQTTSTNTDVVVRLLDVFPDGSAFNISQGIVRRGFTPNTPADIEIELWPTSYAFKRGHKIRLTVSSSLFPHFDRNFNTGQSIHHALTPVKARQTVFHGPSKLVLPVILPSHAQQQTS